jgi:hypothetical protein
MYGEGGPILWSVASRHFALNEGIANPEGRDTI